MLILAVDSMMSCWGGMGGMAGVESSPAQLKLELGGTTGNEILCIGIGSSPRR
jgi:hypothetical protein